MQTFSGAAEAPRTQRNDSNLAGTLKDHYQVLRFAHDPDEILPVPHF
jgi:hypothetical protein